MKINKPHNFLLLALTAVLSCCSGEDYSDITVSGSSSAAPLSITVTDGGYAGGTSTRVSEDGYRTVFTEGDEIGIFAVKDGAIVEGISNLRLTAHAATDANAALTWQAYNNKTPFNIDGATYYAYYPYRPDIVKLNPQADDAAGFFAGVIRNWKPATDQSTYAKYTAQDLMIAKGVLTPTADGSGNSLSFSMSHEMLLVVIDIPFIKYHFTNLTGSSSDYIIDFPDKKFNNFTPYRVDNGIYRYLVGRYGLQQLSGSYTSKYGLTRWKLTALLGKGAYKIFKVDGGSSTPVEKDHELKVGDFFMKDGTLISGDRTLTSEQRADCIGIVFWVGDPTAQDPTLRKDHPDCIHGLVVALKAVSALGGPSWQLNSRSVQGWLDVNRPNEYLSVLGGTGDSKDPLNNIQGYNNTKAIEEFNSFIGGIWNDQAQAVWSVVSFRKKVPTPVHTSEWYLPSVKELALLCGTGVDIRTKKNVGTTNRDLIEKKLLYSIGNVRADPLLPSSIWGISDYWSSTECSIDDAFSVDFRWGDVSTMKKDEDAHVRYVLAF